MKFSLVSDLHADFPQPPTPYESFEEVIVVAGDTTNGLDGLRFLNKLRRKGHHVIACDGNHEHYSNLSQGRDVNETATRFREEFWGRDQVEDVPFVCRNGWYPVTDEALWRSYMNDSARCVLSATDVNVLAINHAAHVEAELLEWRNHQYRGVVVTHTAPCEDTLDPKYRGAFSNEWYWNPNMRRLLTEYADVIRVWCHGHTHAKNEAVVDGVRVVCNPRGYPGENPVWEPWTIEV